MHCSNEGSAQKRCTVISEKRDSVKKGKNDCHDDFQIYFVNNRLEYNRMENDLEIFLDNIQIKNLKDHKKNHFLLNPLVIKYSLAELLQRNLLGSKNLRLNLNKK